MCVREEKILLGDLVGKCLFRNDAHTDTFF